MKTRPPFALRRIAVVLAAVMSITWLVAAPHATQADKPPRFSVLVFTRTAGFAHPSIPSAVTALEELGQHKGFEVVATTDPTMFNPTELAKYDAVVFVNTTGNVLPLPSQRSALEGYIRAGGGWVGAHAASDVGSDRSQRLAVVRRSRRSGVPGPHPHPRVGCRPSSRHGVRGSARRRAG